MCRLRMEARSRYGNAGPNGCSPTRSAGSRMSKYMPATLAVPCPECDAPTDFRCYSARSHGFDRKEPHRVRGRTERMALSAATHERREMRPRLEIRSIADRILDSVVVDEEGCWLWRKKINRGGYGQIKTQNSRRSAHRVSYEEFVGPIPAGLVVDHLCHLGDGSCIGGQTCRHRRCVNPQHLQVVTQGENIRRGLRGRAPRRVECANHVMVTPKPGSGPGQPYCRTCADRRRAAWKTRQSAT